MHDLNPWSWKDKETRILVYIVIICVLILLGLGTANADTVNKQELTNDDIAWLDKHRSENNHGVLGSIFYIKTQVGYISFPVKKLVELGQEKGEQHVKLLITERFRDIQLDELGLIRDKLTDDLNILRSEIIQLQTFIILLGGNEEDRIRLANLTILELELTNKLYK